MSERAQYWDRVGEVWQHTHAHTLWRAHSDEIYSALLEAWLSAEPVSRALKTDLFDEACSAGLVPVLASRSREVVGVDLSMITTRAARGRCSGLRASQCDVRHLPYADGVFDVVVSNSTLDHFASRDDLKDGLAELCRVLRRGGELLLSLDNLSNPAIAVRNALPRWLLLCWCRWVPYDVGATCGPKLLHRMLSETGFRVVEMRALMHHPSVIAVALAGLLQRHASDGVQRRYLRLLRSLECLAQWPTRFVTGHYVAARARKN